MSPFDERISAVCAEASTLVTVTRLSSKGGDIPISAVAGSGVSLAFGGAVVEVCVAAVSKGCDDDETVVILSVSVSKRKWNLIVLVRWRESAACEPLLI